MEKLKNSINWFEIAVIDFDRAQKFYSEIYDYEMPATYVGKTRMGFFLYEQATHRVGGAICQGKGYEPSKAGALIYLNGGKDLNNVLNRVEDAGGKVLTKKTEIPGNNGFYAMFLDTEGNRIALHSRD